MAHAEFVPDVGIGCGEVRDDQVGHQQFLKHVRANIAGTDLAVGTERFQPRFGQCRRDVLGINAIEVDRRAIRARLDAKGHRNKGMGFGGHEGSCARR